MRRFSNRVVIAGGSGGVGQALVAYFDEIGIACTVLSRSGTHIEGAHRSVRWMDGESAWTKELEGAYAVVNLCGEPIAQKWTSQARQRILDSRVAPTRMLGDAIAEAQSPPMAWVNASAIGIYGETGQSVRDEESPPGSGFMAETCRAWESAAHQAPPSPTVRSIVRIGVVLDPKSGYLRTICDLTRKGLGGRLGNGLQWISWIHIRDLCRVIHHVIDRGVGGPFNAVAPHPVQQKELSDTLVKKLQAPFAPPAPSFAVRLGTTAMGLDPDLVLGSSRIAPNALLRDGFEFQFEQLQDALDDLL